MREIWLVVLDGQTHRIEAEYTPATGALRLLHDGQVEKDWPGGFIEGARMSAAHGFDIGSHQVEFSAGLSKLHRHFDLDVDRRRIQPEKQPMSAATMLMAALMGVGGVVLLGIMMGWWGER